MLARQRFEKNSDGLAHLKSERFVGGFTPLETNKSQIETESLGQSLTGFMIVELIVTLIVASVLVLSLHTIVTSHGYVSNRSKSVVLVNAFAEHKVEALRSAGFLNLTDGTTTVTSEMPGDLLAPRSAILTISSQTDAIKKIHLSITYNEQGASKTQTYTTYIGELGVGQY